LKVILIDEFTFATCPNSVSCVKNWNENYAAMNFKGTGQTRS
jgi:hypothetical protein